MTRIFLVLLVASSSAWAQFAGDVFFEDPSVTAPQGQPVTLHVQTFSGDLPLGGAHFRLLYDAADLAIDAVRVGSAGQFQDVLVTAPDNGSIGVVTLNGAALDEPFGTISLVEVVARPLAAPGALLEVRIDVVSLVDTASAPFPEQGGLSARITVTDGAMLQQNPAAGPPPTPDEVAWAERLRRPGHRVVVWRGFWSGVIFAAEPVDVTLLDQAARKDD